MQQPSRAQIKREIRPTVYGIDVQRGPDGEKLLTIIHPQDGEAFVYNLTDELAHTIVTKLTGGIEIAREVPE